MRNKIRKISLSYFSLSQDDNGDLLSSPYHVGIVTVPAPNAGVMKEVEAIRNAMTERVKSLL
jgi:uncharacterized protein (TIGR02452 family)